MNRLELDDTDSQIGYAGAWILLKGSSRQWQSTTHTTTETGAFASVNFQGTRVVVYITVPIGSGTGVHATVTLDGAQTAISHQTNTTAIYNVILFDSGPISDTPHTISLTNAGSALDSPLQFDRFHLEGENFNVSPGIVPTAIEPSANTPQGSTSAASSTFGNSQLPGTLRPISSGNSLGPSIAPTAATSTALQSTSLSTAIGGTEGPQNFAVPESAKGITTVLPFQTNLLSSPTSISVTFITTTEANGTVVTNTVASVPTASVSPARASVGAATIAGSILGGVIFISLLALLMLRLLRRRDKKQHVLVYENAEPPDLQSGPSTSTITPFHHDALHQLTVDVKSQGGQGTHLPMSPRSRSEMASSVVGSPSSIAPTIFSGHQNSPLHERYSHIESNGRPYIYLPRLDQITDTGSVPIGSSVMLLLMDSELNHVNAGLPPSYHATV